MAYASLAQSYIVYIMYHVLHSLLNGDQIYAGQSYNTEVHRFHFLLLPKPGLGVSAVCSSQSAEEAKLLICSVTVPLFLRECGD